MKKILPVLFVIASLIEHCWTIKLYLSVEENTKPSTPIGNLIVMVKNQTDIKLTLDLKSLQLTNENSDNYGTKNYIKIDPKNGDIWLQASLDREELCSLRGNCDGNTYLDYLIDIDKMVLELKIEIIDINDNSPTFSPEENKIEIPEGIAKSTTYSLPVAKDKDSKQFGVKRYILKSISNSDDEKYFKLSMKESIQHPYLMVVRELDRESKDSFEFYLFAIDGSGNQGKCKIIVKITDINDNTPQWIGLPYRHKVKECTTDNKIKKLMAEDSDDPSTNGGHIQYKISENAATSETINQKFYITDDTLYSNNGALRSVGRKLSVYVLATDGGGRTNETTVDIEIIDCNDHAPAITVTKAMPTVTENDNSVKSLTRISVRDKDQGVNSEFNCNLNDTSHVTLTATYVNSDDSHRIRRFDLQTVADMSFDREKTPRHSVEIQCIDNGHPPMSSTSVITIYIDDVNDNRPKFDVEFRIFLLSEDARIGSEVGKVIATDDDVNPNNVISYSIVGDENVRNTFSVTQHGYIQLLTSIDREKIDKYEFKILAVDSGQPSMNDSCSIKIMIQDVNDCRPEIDKEFKFTIVESYSKEMTHKKFGKLNATDRDAGYNGSITFRLRSVSPNTAAIKVLSDGQLSIYGIIDREKTERIEAEILVTDGGRPPLIATTTVIIEVLDLNDNKPKFEFPNFTSQNIINVSLDTSVGTIIGQLKAKDPDKDANGTIDFKLIGNDSQKKLFVINQDGQIILNEKLTSNRKFDRRLFIEAKDRGVPPLFDTSTLYISFVSAKADNSDTKRSMVNAGRKNKNTETNSQKYGPMGWSNVMMLIYFLAAAIFLIIIGIGGTFLYLWCRGQYFCQRAPSKQSPARELNSAGYQKNSAKVDNNRSILEINNQFLTNRKENSYQVIDPQCQVIAYPSLMKTYGSGPIEHPYQFRPMMVGGGNTYSAFNPRSSSPMIDKDNQELSPFTSLINSNSNNNDDIWDRPSPISPASNPRTRQTSDEIDNVYDNSKYNVSIPNNFDPSHFTTTPSQSRRSGPINTGADHTYKGKVNYVASSFV